MTVLSGSACLKAIISLIDAFYVDNNNKSALNIINKQSPAQAEELIQILKNNLNDGK